MVALAVSAPASEAKGGTAIVDAKTRLVVVGGGGLDAFIGGQLYGSALFGYSYFYGNYAGRNGGEYYTPRPLIRAMIEVVKPQIGERIYDGACGSAGFLCEAFEHLTKDRGKESATNLSLVS